MFFGQWGFCGHPLLRFLKNFSNSSRRTRFTLCPRWRTGNRLALAHLRTWGRLTFVSSAISANVINIYSSCDWELAFLVAVELRRQNLLVAPFSQNLLPGDWWKIDARWCWRVFRSNHAESIARSCLNGHRPHGEIAEHLLDDLKLETLCISLSTNAAMSQNLNESCKYLIFKPLNINSLSIFMLCHICLI